MGRLIGTLGSGALYSLVGEDFGEVAGTDAVAGLASCFLAGTISSLLAALITFKIDDDESGLMCGSCCTIVPVKVNPNLEEVDAVSEVKKDAATQTREEKEAATQTEELPMHEWNPYLPRPPSMSEIRW